MRRAAALVVAVLAIGIVALAQGPRRDGKWEVTTEMDMPGMPMKMPPFTNIQCVTKEEANDPLKAAPKGRGGRDADDGGRRPWDDDDEVHGQTARRLHEITPTGTNRSTRASCTAAPAAARNH